MVPPVWSHRWDAMVRITADTKLDSLSDPGRTCPNVTETDFRRLIDCESFFNEINRLIYLFINRIIKHHKVVTSEEP